MSVDFGLAQPKPEGVTIVLTDYGYYYVTDEDLATMSKKNSKSGKDWKDKRTKAWKWIWKKANKETRGR